MRTQPSDHWTLYPQHPRPITVASRKSLTVCGTLTWLAVGEEAAGEEETGLRADSGSDRGGEQLRALPARQRAAGIPRREPRVLSPHPVHPQTLPHPAPATNHMAAGAYPLDKQRTSPCGRLPCLRPYHTTKPRTASRAPPCPPHSPSFSSSACSSFASSALEATQGQIDGFFGQLPYKYHQNRVASVGECVKICPRLICRVGGTTKSRGSRRVPQLPHPTQPPHHKVTRRFACTLLTKTACVPTGVPRS